MKTLETVVVVFVVAVGLAGCGGDAERGESCDKDVPCEASLECIPLAIGCESDCPGTCEIPCETNADCASGEVCVATRGDEFCEDEEFHVN